MLTQDVILGIIALTAMLCFTLSIASMLLAARRLASSNVKAAGKAAGKAAETEAAGAEVTKGASAVAVASEEEDASKRGKR